MEYKFNEYERIFDTPSKKMEERTIVEKILSILNENDKYNSLENFYNDNMNFETFLKNNNLENVLKHFGNQLNQDDYDKIINNLRKMVEKKSTFDTDNIQKNDIDEKQYVTYNGKSDNYYLNNSYDNKSIEEQMEEIQRQTPYFQTSDTNENTELIMKEMKEKKKINLILRYLNEINFEILTQEQQDLFKFAFDYQQKNPGLIRIDLDESVMIDEKDNIMKIEKIDGNYKIINGDEDYNKPEDTTINLDKDLHETKSKSLNLMPKTQLFS